MTAPLQASAAEELSTEGFATFGRVLSRSETETFRSEVRELVSAGSLPEGVTRQDDGRTEDGSATFHTMFGACQALHPDLVERLVSDAVALLGGSTRLLSDELFVKPAVVGAALSWHQDWPVYPDLQAQYLTFWVALSDVDSTRGALQFVPGSHRQGRFLPGEFRNGVVPDPRLLALEDSLSPLPEVREEDAVDAAPLSAGEASVHHCHTWHRSHPNRSGVDRAAAVVRVVLAD